MFDSLKQRYQDWQLKKLLRASRDKTIKNWDVIHTVGLIFVVGSAEEWNLISRFISAQKKQGKQIFLIGFHPKDYAIDYIFTHTETTICREKEDLSFWGLPKADVINNFTERHYDLLIDTTTENFFGKYITALSNADLKVGYYNPQFSTLYSQFTGYDLTIQGNDQFDLKKYLEQVVKYLSMIKK